MFSVGDFVKVKNTDIYGVVVALINVFNVAQQTDDMLAISITGSTETKLFKLSSVEKILPE